VKGIHLKSVHDFFEHHHLSGSTSKESHAKSESWLESTGLPTLLHDIERWISEFEHRPFAGFGAIPFSYRPFAGFGTLSLESRTFAGFGATPLTRQDFSGFAATPHTYQGFTGFGIALLAYKAFAGFGKTGC